MGPIGVRVRRRGLGISRDPAMRDRHWTQLMAITGKAGTTLIFDCNTLHASGHNLSAKDRWQIYLCYNLCDNRPADIESPRPDYVRSINWAPMEMLDDDVILKMDWLAVE